MKKDVIPIEYKIYTDGSCSGNPGTGGYAFVITKYNKVILKVAGRRKKATNNQMELLAIIKSIKHLNEYIRTQPIEVKKKAIVTIISDSAYCVNAIKFNWIEKWKLNGWTTSARTKVKNKEMWLELEEEIKDTIPKIEFEKVKGHSGNKFNEMVDELAKKAVKGEI